MKQNTFTTCVTLSLATALFTALPHQAKASFLTHRWTNQREVEKAIRVAPELTYYSTQANYRSDGTAIIPGNFDSYSQTRVDATLAFGAFKDFTLYGRVSFIHANSSTTTQTLTGSGFSDQSVGLNYHLFESPAGSALDVQFQADLPAYDNTQAAAGAPFRGDGTTDLTFGLFFTTPVSYTATGTWTIDAGSGFTKRNNSFASGIPFSVQFERRPSDAGFRFGAGFFGYQSLSSPLLPDGRVVSGSVGASGSFIVNSPKPSFGAIHGNAGWDFSRRTSVLIAYNNAFFGSAAPQAWWTTASLVARFGEGAQGDVRRPVEQERSNDGFVNYGLQGKVIKTNDKMNLVRINKGVNDGMEVGQLFDFFSTRGAGAENRVIEEPIARGRVTHVRERDSVLTVIEYFKEVWVDEGFTAKRVL